jgi:hypothetical protein
MSTIIGVDRLSLENAAQWLEARCDPMQSAQEIRKLIEIGKPAHPELLEQLVRVLRVRGSHTCAVHKGDRCQICTLLDLHDRAKSAA